MKNVTIALPDSVYKEARMTAAKVSKSLSRFVSDLLQKSFESGSEQQAAMRAFLSRPPIKVTSGQKMSRDEMHAR